MQRAKHSLSHYRLASLKQGELTPITCLEVLPGDSIRHQVGALVRISPLVAPVMHPVEVSIHCWFVPHRIVWSNFEDFITRSNPALTIPTISLATGDANARKLASSLGAGITVAGANAKAVVLNSLAFRAYNLIYNEFYRDQDLVAKVPERTGDTGDLPADYSILNVAWEKDYFTTCRAQPQLGVGDEVVPITFAAGSVNVKGIGVNNHNFPAAGISVFESGGGNPTYANAAQLLSAANPVWYGKGTAASGGTAVPDITVDLSGVTGGSMSINSWRRSMALQKFREHRNRYGSRYRDLLAFLGVRSSDARLQRPEYLGGGRQTVAFSEVLSTADVGTADVGSMAGHGIAAVRTRGYRRFFEEHGHLICCLYARPRTVYMNAVPRGFLRRTYEDVWQKELEMMGEQGVTNFEVYGDSATPSGTFGYIPRYDEYRHMESSIYGEFRNTLNFWHMARDFGAVQPALNGTFVTADPTTRIYASTSTDQLYVMASNRISARRLVSKRARS